MWLLIHCDMLNWAPFQYEDRLPRDRGYLYILHVNNSSISIMKHPSPVKLHAVFHKGHMCADDVIIYSSAMSTHQLECKLRSCIDSIFNWYDMNKLCINKKKSSVMIIGSKFQLRPLNLDEFVISVNADKLQLVKQASYLGLWIRNDLS